MQPVLIIELPVVVTWEPHDTSRCRCVCRFFHNTSGTCENSADPRLRARIITPRELTLEPVEVCAPCYERIAGCGPVRTEKTALPLAVWQDTTEGAPSPARTAGSLA